LILSFVVGKIGIESGEEIPIGQSNSNSITLEAAYRDALCRRKR
jgi:hypothetical protein